MEDLSFSLGGASIIGYVGPNGAGKTTTIKLMMNLLTQDSGELSILGKSYGDGAREIYGAIGYMPQIIAFQEWRRLDGTLELFGRLSGIPNEELPARVEEVLEIVGLKEKIRSRISELSGGMKRKLGLAQAILHRPEVLILDEPLVGLDPSGRLLFKSIIRDLAREGVTVFFSSHILGDVEDIVDEIIILAGGRKRFRGGVEELRSRLKGRKEIRLSLSHDEGAAALLREIRQIVEISHLPGDECLLRHKDEADGDLLTHEIIENLLKGGCRIRSIAPVSDSLEDLFAGFIEQWN